MPDSQLMDDLMPFTLNGEAVSIARQTPGHVADLLRHHFRLTGTHVGCEHGVCGACNVRADGVVVRSCLCSRRRWRECPSRRSKALTATARRARCRTPSSRATPCSAATARPAC